MRILKGEKLYVGLAENKTFGRGSLFLLEMLDFLW